VKGLDRQNNKDWYKPIPIDEILSSKPKSVDTYDELVQDVAQILHRNKEYVVYYRGQAKDYRDKNNRTSILPSIYRKKDSPKLYLKKNFKILNDKVDELRKLIKSNSKRIAGSKLIDKHIEIAWAILQHYEVCDTPLLDITHSLHVACSFAFHKNPNETGVIYLLGMPWQTDSLGVNTFEELINMRLLSIMPPDAKRPYFQEGYLTGPFPRYRLDDTNRIKHFDYAKRLIAKFEIPRIKDFWGAGFEEIPNEKLFQPNDELLNICRNLKDKNY
jgi:hypothetical protein